MAIICLTGWYTPGDADTQVNPSINLNNLIQEKPVPSFDEVLIPLRASQAAKAEADRVAEEARVAAAQVEQERLRQVELDRAREVKAAQPSIVPTGSHTDWLTAAGIDPANWGYVEYIVSHESGWNPCSYYPGKSNCSLTPDEVNATSGNPLVKVACGMGMQLPCGKWAGAWNDPIAALRAMDIYVNKFGGWYGAYLYWLAHGNY